MKNKLKRKHLKNIKKGDNSLIWVKVDSYDRELKKSFPEPPIADSILTLYFLTLIWYIHYIDTKTISGV